MLGLVAASLVLPAISAAPNSAVQDSWKRRKVASLGISVELPAEPTAEPLRFATELKSIKTPIVYKLNHGGIIVRLTLSEYTDGVEPDVSRAMDATINQLKKTTGVTELKWTIRETTISGKDAMQLESKYQFRGSPVSYWVLMCSDGPKMWQIGGTFKTASAEHEIAIKRILGSVKLEK